MFFRGVVHVRCQQCFADRRQAVSSDRPDRVGTRPGTGRPATPPATAPWGAPIWTSCSQKLGPNRRGHRPGTVAAGSIDGVGATRTAAVVGNGPISPYRVSTPRPRPTRRSPWHRTERAGLNPRPGRRPQRPEARHPRRQATSTGVRGGRADRGDRGT